MVFCLLDGGWRVEKISRALLLVGILFFISVITVNASGVSVRTYTPLEKDIALNWINSNCAETYDNWQELVSDRTVECDTLDRPPAYVDGYYATSEVYNTKKAFKKIGYVFLYGLAFLVVLIRLARNKANFLYVYIYFLFLLILCADAIAVIALNTPTYFFNSDKSLHYAAREGDLGQLKHLIEVVGKNPNRRNLRKKTPLEIADERRFADITSYLAQYTPELNSEIPFGKTSLQTAIGTGNVELVKKVLERDGIKYKRKFGQITLLQLAAIQENAEIIKLLVESGVDYKERTSGRSPIQIAVFRDNLPVVNYLVKLDQDLGHAGLYESIALGNLPLYYHFKSMDYEKDNTDIFTTAAIFGRLDFLEALDEKNELEPLTSEEVVRIAARVRSAKRSGSVHGALYLLKKYAPIKDLVPITDGYRRNLAIAAVQRNRCDLIKVALENGSDPYQKDSFGYHAIDYAESTNDSELTGCFDGYR